MGEREDPATAERQRITACGKAERQPPQRAW